MIILRASYPNDQLLVPDPPRVTVDLDVLEADQPILLDISAIENNDIGSLFGVSSQTFSLPGTDNNNQFFGNLFDLGATPNIALQKSVDCQVLTDGDEVFSGKMYIVDIVTDQKGYTTYQVNIVNETVDFKFQLENYSICDLDTNGLLNDFTFNYYFVSQSWSDNLYNGDIVFPHVEYGIPQGNTDLPLYELGTTNANDRKIDNINYPLQLQQFLPAFRVKTMIDIIFDNLGYKYTSSFFETDYFNNIYFLATNDETLGPSPQDATSGSFWAYSSVNRAASVFTPLTIDFTDEVYDNANAMDLGTNLFTAYTDGFYDLEVQLQYSISNYQQYPANAFDISLVSGSGASIATQTFVNPPQANTLYASYQQIYLTEGQTVKVVAEYSSPDPNLTPSVTYIATNENSISFKLTQGPTAVLSSNISIPNQWPCDVSALDFMLGLAEKFNLVIEPIPGERNKLRIDPFQTWADDGAVKDWTDRIDRSQKFKISHPISEQPKTIYFRDEDDEAAPNKYTVDNFGEVFGTYIREELDSDLPQGEKEIGSLFAATPVKGVSNTNMIIPTLAKRDDTGQLRPMKFKPRLLYKNGIQDVPSSAAGWTADQDCYEYYIENRDPVQSCGINYIDCGGTPQTTAVLADSEITIYAQPTPTKTGPATQVLVTQIAPVSQSRWPGSYFIEDENGVIHQETQYLQMTTFEYLPTDASGSISGSRDLHFGNLDNPGWWKYFQPQVNGRTTRDAYHEYWATYINSLYDVDARKLACNVFLEPSDIADIRLNDKIFIDGHYYRINNISGADITKPASVEVELIKQLNRKLTYPRRRIATGSEEPVDITVGGYEASGRVQYVDFYGGGVIDDYAIVSQAARKDGLTVFADTNNSASVSIVSKQPTNAPINRQIFGANDVDNTSDAVMVAGGANSVARQSNNVLLVGEANTLNSGLTNVTAIGRGNTIERSTDNVSIIGSNSNIVRSGSNDSTIFGGASHEIIASSLVTIVGGAANEISDSPTSRNVILGGLNTTISSSQNTVVINGNGETAISMNGNTLIGNFQDTNDWDGNDYRFGTNVLAGTYVAEDLYLNRHPHNILQYSGSIEYAYSGTGLYKYIYNISFDSFASGSGDSFIELPGIVSQQQEGRAILFKCDATISSTNRVIIKSVAGTDTIDDLTQYILERPNQWVELIASEYVTDRGTTRQWRVVRSGVGNGGSGVPSNYGTYGSFYSTSSQAIVTSGSAQQVTLGNGFTSQSIHLSGSGTIQVDYAGSYKLSYTATVENQDNAIHNAYFWIRYNGVDYPNSTVIVSIPARKSATEYSYMPVTVNLLDKALSNGDKVELWWRGDSTLLSLNYQTFGGTIPASPSIFAQINAV